MFYTSKDSIMLDLFTGNNINAEIANLGNHAILLDVREAGEYVAGHIPGAVNVPLSVMNQFCFPWNKDTAIRVYCLAGTRSRRAVRILQSKGFTNVKNIGGIKFYKGKHREIVGKRVIINDRKAV